MILIYSFALKMGYVKHSNVMTKVYTQTQLEVEVRKFIIFIKYTFKVNSEIL